MSAMLVSSGRNAKTREFCAAQAADDDKRSRMTARFIHFSAVNQPRLCP